jgi:hypothetical protein
MAMNDMFLETFNIYQGLNIIGSIQGDEKLKNEKLTKGQDLPVHSKSLNRYFVNGVPYINFGFPGVELFHTEIGKRGGVSLEEGANISK